MRMIRAAAAALAMAVLLGGVASPAGADPYDRDQHDQHDQRRAPVRHRRPPPPPRRDWGYDVPTYVQAPPPMVYAPPEGPAVLNFSLNFR